MTAQPHAQQKSVPRHSRQQLIWLSIAIAFGLSAVIGMSRWMDAHRPPVDAAMEEEKLYLTGATAKRLSLGFNGLAADWYWMRTLQYVGRKVLAHEGDFQLDDLGKLDLKLLYPLLDTTTTLDPHFMAAYEYGAVILPAVNEEDAIKLIKKGMQDNPQAWRLHHHLGYIYWKRGDYKLAGETYEAGAKIPGAPPWMKAMVARMESEGGSRATAREIYARILEQADDESIKEMAARRLLQLDSLDERDAIRAVLTEYSQRQGRCASGWGEVYAALRAVRLPSGKQLRFDASGTPYDPSDAPYTLLQDKCDVGLDAESKIIAR